MWQSSSPRSFIVPPNWTPTLWWYTVLVFFSCLLLNRSQIVLTSSVLQFTWATNSRTLAHNKTHCCAHLRTYFHTLNYLNFLDQRCSCRRLIHIHPSIVKEGKKNHPFNIFPCYLWKVKSGNEYKHNYTWLILQHWRCHGYRPSWFNANNKECSCDQDAEYFGLRTERLLAACWKVTDSNVQN